MADPITLTAIGITMSVLSTGAGVMGAMQQSAQQKNAAKAQGQAAEYNAQLARNQAEVNRQNSEIARQQGVIQAEALRSKQFKLFGSQTAAVGASGVTMSGSAMDVFDESNSNAQEDIMQSRFDTEMRRWNFDQGVSNSMAQAALETSKASNAYASGKSQSPMFGIASAVIGGATQAYGSYSAANPSFQKTSYSPNSYGTVSPSSSSGLSRNPIDTLYGR